MMQTTTRRPLTQVRSAAATFRLESAALYGSFALISAVVFGTLSIHPF